MLGLLMLDDRLTEKINPRSADIDTLSSIEIVDLIFRKHLEKQIFLEIERIMN